MNSLNDPTSRHATRRETLISTDILDQLHHSTKFQYKQTQSLPARAQSDSELIESTYQHLLSENLLKSSLAAPVRNLDRRMQRKIRRLIPGHLVSKYPEIFRLLMVDVCEDYIKNLRQIAAVQKIKAMYHFGDTNVTKVGDKQKLSKNGSESKKNFKKSLKFFEKNLFLTNHLFRFVQNESALMFAQTNLINLSLYRKRNGINFPLLRACIKNEISTNQKNTVHVFVEKIAKKFVKAKFLLGLEPRLWVKFVIAVKKFIAVRIMLFLSESTNLILKSFHNGMYPLIEFHLNAVNDTQDTFLCLTPEIKEVNDFYTEIINLLTTVRVELPKITAIILLPSHYYKYQVTAAKYYQFRVIREMKVFHKRLLSSMNDHLEQLRVEFEFLFSAEYNHKIENLGSSREMENSNISNEIDFLNGYKNKTEGLLAKLDFENGCLHQKKFIDSLLLQIKQYQQTLYTNLVNKCGRDLEHLNTELEIIYEKAVKIPENTAELMELTKFISDVKEVKLTSLKADVDGKFLELIQLLEVANVPQEMSQLNANLITSLEIIPKALDENVGILENRKNELEENLQKKFDDLNSSINEYLINLPLLDLMSDLSEIQSYMKFLKPMILRVKDFENDLNSVNEEERLFKFPLSTIPELIELKETIFKLVDLIWLCKECVTFVANCMDGPFEKLTYDRANETTNKLKLNLNNFQKYYSEMIKQQIADNVTRRFKGMVDDPDPYNYPAPLKLCSQSLSLLMEFETKLRLIKCFCSLALRQRHWDEMSVLAEKDLTPDFGSTLRKISENSFDDSLMEQFEVIQTAAVSELELNELLKRLIDEFNHTQFELEVDQAVSISKITNFNNILEIIDQQLGHMSSIKASPFVIPIKNDVENRISQLKMYKDLVVKIMFFQKTCLKYHKFLTNPNLQEQFEQFFLDLKEYVQLHKIFSAISKTISENLEVYKINSHRKQILDNFQDFQDILKKILISVKCFLSNAKKHCSRFHVLHDDELIELFGIHTNINNKQFDKFIFQCFPGVNSLLWLDNQNIITGVLSVHGETLMFYKNINFDISSLPKSFCSIEHVLMETMKKSIVDCYSDLVDKFLYSNLEHLEGLEKWAQLYPQQTIMIALNLMFTQECERAFENSSELSFNKFSKLNKSIKLISRLETNFRIKNTYAIILIELHQFQVIFDKITQNNVKPIDNISWISNIRYYLTSDNLVKIKYLHYYFDYNYEYLGGVDCSVLQANHCALIEKLTYCKKMNLIPILDPKLIFNKTLCAFSQIFGVSLVNQCITEKTNTDFMKGVFKGINDNENLIWCISNIEELAGQNLNLFVNEFIQHINSNFCNFFVVSGNLNEITLPKNISEYFLKITDHNNENDLDVRTYISTFFSVYDFNDSEALTRKILTLKTELNTFAWSSQLKFDFDSIKIILEECIALNRNINNEELALFQTLEKQFVSQLNEVQAKTFNILLKSLFPSSESSFNLNDRCDELDPLVVPPILVKNEYFLKKISQIHQALSGSRKIILLFGKSCCKTTVLKECLKNLNISHEIVAIDHMTCFHTHGYWDRKSGQWNKGLLEILFQKTSCLVLDGDITPLKMIDFNLLNFYSPTGNIISKNDNFRLINEIDEISKLTPAILAASTLINFEPKSLGMEPILLSNLTQVEKKLHDNLYVEIVKNIFSSSLPKLFNFTKNKLILQLDRLHLTQSIFNVFLMYLNDVLHLEINVEDKKKFFHIWIQAICITSITSVLFNLIPIQDDLNQINVIFKDFWKELTVDEKIVLPYDGLLSDYFYVFKQKGMWKNLPDMHKNGKFDSANFYCDMVLDINLAKISPIIEMHFKSSRPMILFGSGGVGKTSYIKNIYKNKFTNEYNLAKINLLPNFQAETLQSILLNELRMEKFNQKHSQRKNLIFVDNFFDGEYLNDSVDFLRQVYDQKFCYQKNIGGDDGYNKISLENVLVFNAISDTGGCNVKDISPRYLKYFNIYYLPQVENEGLFKIFSTILFKNLRLNNFPNDIAASLANFIQPAINFYNDLKTDCLTQKYPILFSTMDLNRLVQGLSLLHRDSFDNKSGFSSLAIHEMTRVFLDKIIDKEILEDKQKSLVEVINKQFDSSLDYNSDTFGTNFIFGSYLSPGNVDYGKVDFDRTMETFGEKLKETEADDIVLFKETIIHLVKICRLYHQCDGNGLLVGPVGTGKKTLCELASYIYQFQTFSINIVPNYSQSHWREDFRSLLLKTGTQNVKSSLILENYNLYPYILEDLFSYVSTGLVQDLYENDEQKQVIFDTIQVVAQKGNRSMNLTSSDIMTFFEENCHKNLHIFICLDSSKKSDQLQSKALFGSLSKYFTTICFPLWSNDALEEVAMYCLPDSQSNTKLVQSCTKMYQQTLTMTNVSHSTWPMFITSYSFIFFLRTYSLELSEKTEEINILRKKYQDGLDKRVYALDQITLLKNDIATLEPQIVTVTERSSNMSKEIEKETAEVARASQQIRDEEKIVNIQAAAAESLKQECEKDLALAIPILEDAIVALNTLKPTDITLVKSMKNPPDVIKLVMAAVCVMKEIKPDRLPDVATGRKVIDYWGPSKRLLGEMNFLQQLKDFDKDNIPASAMQKIREEYLPHKGFQPHVVAKASSAAEGLCKWVIAMDLYDKVAKEVAPKKEKLAEAEAKYKKTLSELNEKRSQLAKIEKHLASLNKQFQDNNQDLSEMITKLDKQKDRLDKAEKFVESLEGEKLNWIENLKSLVDISEKLQGDLLLFVATLAYFGPFIKRERDELMKYWKSTLKSNEINFSDSFEPIFRMTNSIKFINWEFENKFNDYVVKQNVRILNQSQKWCILIDPHLQGKEYLLKNHESIVFTKLCDDDCFEKVTNGIKNGAVVICENINNKIPAYFYQILKFKKISKDGKDFVKFNDTLIPYNKSFQLYITCNFDTSNFSSETYHLATVINFTLNKSLFLENLSNIVVIKNARLESTIESQWYEKLDQSHKHKKALIQNKIDLLTNLNESDLNVLDDKAAIENFRKIKDKISELNEKFEQLQAELDFLIQGRAKYSKFTQHCLVMYNLLFEFSKINNFYEYSLKFFVQLFRQSITKADRSKDFNVRLHNLMNRFNYDFYVTIVKSIEERDTRLFAFLFCLVLDNEIELVDVILNCKKSTVILNCPENVDCKVWEKICFLESFQFFKENTDWWKSYLNDSITFLETINQFKDTQILTVKYYLYRDQFESEIEKYKMQKLKPNYFNINNLDTLSLFTSSTSLTPIVFNINDQNPINPTPFIRKMVNRLHFENHFCQIPSIVDREKLKTIFLKKQTEECWLLIENCHTDPIALKMLAELISNLTPANTHYNFRLWLVTESSRKWSKTVIQNCVKISCFESGILDCNLLNLYQNEVNTENYERENDTYKKCLLSMAIFHGLMTASKRVASNVMSFRISTILLKDYSSKIINFDIFKNVICNFCYDIVPGCDRTVEIVEVFLRVFSDLDRLFSDYEGNLEITSLIEMFKEKYCQKYTDEGV